MHGRMGTGHPSCLLRVSCQSLSCMTEWTPVVGNKVEICSVQACDQARDKAQKAGPAVYIDVSTAIMAHLRKTEGK